MKQCNRCHCVKPTTEFYKKPTAKDGLFWWCRNCHKQYVKADYHKKAENPEYIAHERARIRAYSKSHPDKVAAWGDKYRVENTAKLTANAKRYVLAREQRTPAWLTDDDYWLIEQFYDLARLRTQVLGYAWHVDHIIPLHGKVVSGLHVPDNLQVVPATVNRSKSNNFEVT